MKILENKNDTVIYGGIKWPDTVIAHKVDPNQPHTANHTPSMGRDKWIYYQSKGIVFWWIFPPTQNSKNDVQRWLNRKGYEVVSHREMNDYFLVMKENDSDHNAALQRTGFWGKKGAGSLIMSRVTGRFLIQLRGDYVEEPNTWGTWGGAVDEGKTPEQGALTEFEEETGKSSDDVREIIPVYVFKHPSGFEYHNFIITVDDEFTPRPGREHEWEINGFKWVNYGQFPKPFHFGLNLLLQNGKSKIEDIIKKNGNGEKLTESTEGSISKEHEKAALEFIRQVWKVMPKADRFSTYQFSMWMDNDNYLQQMKERLSNQLYPNDDDAGWTFFAKDVEPTLEKLQQKGYERLAKKMNPEDPLFVLKSIVKNKTYEGAKQALFKTSLHSWWYKGGKIKDEDAEMTFKRLYRHAMGETAYDTNVLDRSPRLSDLKQPTNDKSEEIFIQQFAGWKAPNFPDKVVVYRGTNSPLNKIKEGDFVTFDKDYAASYTRGKFKAIVKGILPSKDLRVYKMDVDTSELVYWPEGHQVKKYTGTVPTFREFWETWR